MAARVVAAALRPRAARWGGRRWAAPALAGCVAGVAFSGSGPDSAARCEELSGHAALAMAVGFGIGGYILGIRRNSGTALEYSQEYASAMSVLDEHFRGTDAASGEAADGFASAAGVNQVVLFKWKEGVPATQIEAARRAVAELAASNVGSLGPARLVSGENMQGFGLGGRAADMALVAHFSSMTELEEYQRSAERRQALEAIEPLLAEPPSGATFTNDVPSLVRVGSEGEGAAPSAQHDAGPGAVDRLDYAQALATLSRHEGGEEPPRLPERPPPPPPAAPQPAAQGTTAAEADAILAKHFAARG